MNSIPQKRSGEDTILIRDAKTLLQSHRMLLSRKVVVSAQIDSIAMRERANIDGKIEEMALSVQRLNGLPRAGRRGSATEHIALHYHELFERDVRDEVAALEAELQGIELNLTIYDAMLMLLTKAEASLVKQHYEEGISFAKMIEEVDDQDILKVYSVSTLKRMNQAILSKIDLALGNYAVKRAY